MTRLTRYVSMAMAGWHLGQSHGKACGQLGTIPDVQLSRSLFARHRRGKTRRMASGGDSKWLQAAHVEIWFKLSINMACICQEWDGFGVNEVGMP